MGFSKRYKKQRGGQTLTGLDVNSIKSFSPSSIPNLVLWIQADESFFKTATVLEYANEQLPMIKTTLLDEYSSRLQERVITEIRSAAPDVSNSLVRLELVEELSSTFPKLYKPTGGRPGIDLSSYKEPIAQVPIKVTLISTNPIDIPSDYSFFLDAENISTLYNSTLDRFLIAAAAIQETQPEFEMNAAGETVQKPSAILREFIVYGRKLNPTEQQMLEGYMAYKSNTQHLLPPGHPYIPDATADPILNPMFVKLRPLEQNLHAAAAQIEEEYGKYVKAAGTADAIQTEYDAALRLVADARKACADTKLGISRALLIARAKGNGTYTLDDVKGSLDQSIQVDPVLSKGELALNLVRNLLPKLKSGDQVVAARAAALSTAQIQQEKQEAITDEGLRDVEVAAKRRALSTAEFAIRQEIQRLGSTLLNSLEGTFHSELELCLESFTYQATQRKRTEAELEAKFRTLFNQFQDNSWTAQASFLDTTKEADNTYRDPTLQTLYQKYKVLESGIKGGDVSYLATKLDSYRREVETLCLQWREHPTLALFKSLYIGHLRLRYEQAEELYHQWTRRIEELFTAIDSLNQDLATLSTVKEVSVKPLSFLTKTYLPLPIRYFARLNASDESLLQGFTHVETDENGTPKTIQSATGDLEVLFFVPEALFSTYTLPSGYIHSDGRPILENYKQVPLQTKEGLFPLLPISRIRQPLTHTLQGVGKPPLELSREDVNRIHRISATGEGAQHAVSLPKYAVKANSFYCIQNTGPVPICVRNPGALDDSLTLLGPNEVGVFLYGEGSSLKSSPGFTYGTVDWVEDHLPYDTLLNCPRSKTCVYVSELKTHIYCSIGYKGLLKPLLDSNGMFVPVFRAEDGNVYDLDDYAHSCPYMVRTLPEVSLAKLNFDRSSKLRQIRTKRPSDPIPTVREETTGVSILCSAPGIPAFNGFGLVKYVGTPILWSEEGPKIKGSIEDVRLLGATGVVSFAQKGLESLQFEHLFRSQFYTRYSTGPIFITAQDLPLLDTSGNPIRLPPFADIRDRYAAFEEPAGTMNRAFTSDVSGAEWNFGTPVQLPYKPISALAQAATLFSKAEQTLYRLTSAAEYSKGTLNRLQEQSVVIQSLGETTTESLRKDISDTIILVQERLQGFAEVEGTIERLRVAMRNKTVPAEIVASLGALELKLRDTMMEIQTLTSTVQKAIDNYMFLIERIETVRKFVERLRAEGAAIVTEGFDAIQKRFKQIVQETKSISSPELDEARVLLNEKDAAFQIEQDALEKRSKEKPEYISEIREWLLDLQRDAAKQYAQLLEMRALIHKRLTARLYEADEAKKAAQKAEVESLLAQMRTAQADISTIASLYDSRPTASDASTVEGADGPFAHLKTPSLKTDILPLFGDAVVQPFLDIASTVAASTKAVPFSLSDSDIPVEDVRGALQDIQARLRELRKTIEPAYAVYMKAASEKTTYQLAQIEEALQKAIRHAQTLESQKLAAISSATGRSGLDANLAKLDEIVNAYSLESAKTRVIGTQTSIRGKESNPFLLEPIYKAAIAYAQKGEAAEEELKRAIQELQTAIAAAPTNP